MPGSASSDQLLEVLVSNAPAVSIWQRCNKPVQLSFSGAVPAGIETIEIESVCRVCEVPLTPDLLQRVRHLDNSYRDAVVEDLNKRANKK